METAGKIGFAVKKATRENGFVVVKISRVNTTMAPLLTNEIARIAHSLRATKYVQIPTTQRIGFPYIFGQFIFGK